MKAKASIIALNDEAVTVQLIAGDGLYTDTVTVRASSDYALFSEIAHGHKLYDILDLRVEIVQPVKLYIKGCST